MFSVELISGFVLIAMATISIAYPSGLVLLASCNKYN